MRLCACVGGCERSIDDDVLRRDDVDAVGERRPGQIGVEEGGDAAGAGDAEPDREIFRAVRHQEGDRVSLLQIVGHCPAGVLVGATVVLDVAHLLAVGDEGGLVAVSPREILHEIPDGSRRVLGEGLYL
jgi:hypothetical protein